MVGKFTAWQAKVKTVQKEIHQETCLNFNRDSCKQGSECTHKYVCQKWGGGGRWAKPVSQCAISGPCSNNSPLLI